MQTLLLLHDIITKKGGMIFLHTSLIYR